MDILTDYPKCLGNDVAAEIVQWNIEYCTPDASASEYAEYELTVYLKNGYRLQEYSEIRDTEDAEILHRLWDCIEGRIRAIIGYRDYRGGRLGKKGRVHPWVTSSEAFNGTISFDVSSVRSTHPRVPQNYCGLVRTEVGDHIGICESGRVVHCVDKNGSVSFAPISPDTKLYSSTIGMSCSIGQMKAGYTYEATDANNRKVVYIKPTNSGGAIVCDGDNVSIIRDLTLYMCSKNWERILLVA